MGISTDEENLIFDRIALNDAIQQLSVKQRVVVALILAGYNRDESGKIMGLTRQAVGAIHKRAIKRIRSYLIEQQDF